MDIDVDTDKGIDIDIDMDIDRDTDVWIVPHPLHSLVFPLPSFPSLTYFPSCPRAFPPWLPPSFSLSSLYAILFFFSLSWTFLPPRARAHTHSHTHTQVPDLDMSKRESYVLVVLLPKA